MKNYILGVVLALWVSTALQAQTTYNDTVRTNTWSVYVQGGISGFHGGRSSLYDNSKVTIAPDLNVGVKYNIKPWVRVGANLGYTRINAKVHDIVTATSTNDNFMVGGFPATLTTTAHRIQNTNNADVLGFDLNADFNIMEFWPERKLQRLNVYAGLGVGYLHGWNHGVQTWSYNESAVAKGEGYHNVFSHSYIESTETPNQYNGLYIPLSFSVEYDVLRNFGIGLVWQYKAVPTKAEFSPKGIWSVGLALRYNFVKSGRKVAKEIISSLSEEIRHMRRACSDEKAEMARLSDVRVKALENDLAAIRSAKDSLKKENEYMKQKRTDEVYSVKVLFEHNSIEIPAVFEKRIERLANTLKSNPDKKLMIIGSASTHGLQAYNQKLSDERVKAVRAVLTAVGIEENRIGTEISLGERFMTESEECRRVLISIE